MAADLSAVPTDVLRSRLKTTQTLNRTVMVIFTLIVAAWVLLGYWKTNVPVFISTLALGVSSTAATSIAPSAARAELKRRGELG